MASPLDALRRLIIGLTVRGNQRADDRDARRLATMVVKAKDDLAERIRQIGEVAEQHRGETASWVAPEALGEGLGGRFDACDLRHWLALAGRAGVPAVEARVILELPEEEMAAVSGKATLPEGPLLRRLVASLARWRATAGPAPGDDGPGPAAVDGEALAEKLHAAMDAVPEGWMVRHVRCGPSTLKSLAGSGASGPAAPEVRFGPNLEIGPGWVRTGNRRRVDAGDRRFVEGYAQGPDGVPSVFVARPWVKAARWAVGEDPHRHGTQFAGKGAWPAEWRALVEGGTVVGVASYYGWCGSATPENARVALAVRSLAQRVVDEAARQRAVPVYMPVEWVRMSPSRPAWLEQRFPKGSVNCTLDFIEVEGQGLMLLEGGPAFHYLAGGGHPCAFAGVERPDGVAFRTMPGVLLGDPGTWRETDREGCVLDWDAVAALAARERQAVP